MPEPYGKLRFWQCLRSALGVFLLIVLALSFRAANAAETLPPGHRAYALINRFLELGLVDGYDAGFRVSTVDRDTMARYVAQIFEGKTVEELYASGRVRESDLSDLGDVVNDLLPELTGTQSSRLSDLLDKSTRLKAKFNEAPFTARRTSPTDSKATPAQTAKAVGTTSGTATAAVPARTGKIQIKSALTESGQLVPALPPSRIVGAGTESIQLAGWVKNWQRTVTVRNVSTSEPIAYELNNAEKRAGLRGDVKIGMQAAERDRDGADIRKETASFELKNSRLFDYLVTFEDAELRSKLSGGLKLRPDITEYTVRGREIHGVMLQSQVRPGNDFVGFFGRFLPDTLDRTELTTILVSDKHKFSDKYSLRGTFLTADIQNQVLSLENQVKIHRNHQAELELFQSRYKGLDDNGYELRTKSKVGEKMVVSNKVKNYGQNFATLLNPALNADTRRSDLDYVESVVNYRFTPYISNTTTFVWTHENNALQAAPIIPIGTKDLTSIFLASVPKQPKFLAYFKRQGKDGFDVPGTSSKDDRLDLQLYKIDHKFGNFYPRIGYTDLGIRNRDFNNSLPLSLDTDSKTKTWGFDQKFTENFVLKYDLQLTDNNSQVSALPRIGLPLVVTRTQTDSTIHTAVLDYKIPKNYQITYTWYDEDRRGSERLDKTSHRVHYQKYVRADLQCGFFVERIRYDDRNVATNSYDSNEFALTFTSNF